MDGVWLLMRGNMHHTLWLAGVATALLLVGFYLLAGDGENVGVSPTTEPAFAIKTETATFAGGCFWGVEATFRQVPGVLWTEVGFTGGQTKNPTYKQVCGHESGHAEAVRVLYDPAKGSYQQLLTTFFENHVPICVGRPESYRRSQYRSVIFVHSDQQQQLADGEKRRRNEFGKYAGRVATEITPAGPFYRAEESHQQYYQRQGKQASCLIGSGKHEGRGRDGE